MGFGFGFDMFSIMFTIQIEICWDRLQQCFIKKVLVKVILKIRV